MAADFIHALGNFGNFSNYALHRAFQRTGDSSDEIRFWIYKQAS
jgi:hypothetical protein